MAVSPSSDAISWKGGVCGHEGRDSVRAAWGGRISGAEGTIIVGVETKSDALRYDGVVVLPAGPHPALQRNLIWSMISRGRDLATHSLVLLVVVARADLVPATCSGPLTHLLLFFVVSLPVFPSLVVMPSLLLLLLILPVIMIYISINGMFCPGSGAAPLHGRRFGCFGEHIRVAALVHHLSRQESACRPLCDKSSSSPCRCRKLARLPARMSVK